MLRGDLAGARWCVFTRRHLSFTREAPRPPGCERGASSRRLFGATTEARAPIGSGETPAPRTLQRRGAGRTSPCAAPRVAAEGEVRPRNARARIQGRLWPIWVARTLGSGPALLGDSRPARLPRVPATGPPVAGVRPCLMARRSAEELPAREQRTAHPANPGWANRFL